MFRQKDYFNGASKSGPKVCIKMTTKCFILLYHFGFRYMLMVPESDWHSHIDEQ
jgi:hypothetical protein